MPHQRSFSKSTKTIGLTIGLLCSLPAAAAPLYFDFNKNYATPNASLFLFDDANQEATISNSAGFNQTVNLNADGFYNLFLPSNYQQSGTGIRNTGFKVDSTDPLGGYFINRATASTDMTYVLSEDSLGKSYVVASQGNGFGEGSQVAIHAIEDATEVTFTPKGGAPITVTLNAGETYKYAGGSVDLTGSSVEANKNVSVSSGHACAQMPVGQTYCDTLLEQMIPTENLSSEYFVTASKGAALSPNNSDVVRVIATEDSTDVTIDGVVVATLDKGEFYEYQVGANSGSHIETSKPTMVAQYLEGGQGQNTDPAMSLVPGADTWLDDYRLATPTGTQQFDENYASVVIDSSYLSSLLLNGTAVDTSGFTAIGGTGLSQGIIDLPLNLFNLSADTSFLTMLGGGSLADSYFTYGGSSFAPGISPDPDPEPTPVPAPGTAGLMLIGLMSLLGRRFWLKR